MENGKVVPRRNQVGGVEEFQVFQIMTSPVENAME